MIVSYQVWRQLWRVLERSHVVVIVTDARNPLAYIAADLLQYIRDSGKQAAILLNKADLLPVEARLAWLDYFQRTDDEAASSGSTAAATALARGLPVFLFSAERELLAQVCTCL